MTSDMAGRHGCSIPSATQGSSVMLDGLPGPGQSLDPKFTQEYTTSKVRGFMEVLTLPHQHPTGPSNRTRPVNQKARAETCRSDLGYLVQEWEGKDIWGENPKFSKDRNMNASQKPPASRLC